MRMHAVAHLCDAGALTTDRELAVSKTPPKWLDAPRQLVDGAHGT